MAGFEFVSTIDWILTRLDLTCRSRLSTRLHHCKLTCGHLLASSPTVTASLLFPPSASTSALTSPPPRLRRDGEMQVWFSLLVPHGRSPHRHSATSALSRRHADLGTYRSSSSAVVVDVMFVEMRGPLAVSLFFWNTNVEETFGSCFVRRGRVGGSKDTMDRMFHSPDTAVCSTVDFQFTDVSKKCTLVVKSFTTTKCVLLYLLQYLQYVKKKF